MKTILYIHGMGGGGDSRIPNHLKTLLDPSQYRIIIRTYDFDPPVGRAQIEGWVREEKPDLIIGESLGAAQAMRIKGIPHILVSPALGGPLKLYRAAFWARFAVGRWYLHHIYPVKEGDRQPLKFTYDVLKRYKEHWESALAAVSPEERFFAFFGTQDHFMRSGVVRVELYRKYLGDNYVMYEGSHFMEPELVESLLVPKIVETLQK
jgi:predicted esterase YcpF (UPF0227 family)